MDKVVLLTLLTALAGLVLLIALGWGLYRIARGLVPACPLPPRSRDGQRRIAADAGEDAASPGRVR